MKIKTDYVITFELWNDNGINKSMANAFKQHFHLTVEHDTDKENLINVYSHLTTIAKQYMNTYIEKGFVLRNREYTIVPNSTITRSH